MPSSQVGLTRTTNTTVIQIGDCNGRLLPPGPRAILGDPLRRAGPDHAMPLPRVGGRACILPGPGSVISALSGTARAVRSRRTVRPERMRVQRVRVRVQVRVRVRCVRERVWVRRRVLVRPERVRVWVRCMSSWSAATACGCAALAEVPVATYPVWACCARGSRT
jgi:hypothetical protein